ncbi:MAG: hypothetical protein HKN33_13420 [Pyrinomonadaceae bacterium]|nr:hypothetical protein [Pyrinomonadaceae bacterium]
MNRREFGKVAALASSSLGLSMLSSCATPHSDVDCIEPFMVSEDLSKEMYEKALSITEEKVRGGDDEQFFKKPFIDAAFSKNIFLWDTCFMACFAKYHMDELPVYQALDNFYEQAEPDGFICREYRQDGRPLWPKNHPVSINPPLLAFAELEIYTVSKDVDRLKKVYPILKRNFGFLVERYQGEDRLFFGDALGMGMDNIPRSPRDWTPTQGSGLTEDELWSKIGALNLPAEEQLDRFVSEYKDTRTGVWNEQGRFIDLSAQMAMYALQLIRIAELTGNDADIAAYKSFHKDLKEAINQKCWSIEDGFYYDLGFGKQIKRRHIGAYWTLLGGVVPVERRERFLEKLKDPAEFYRETPLPCLSATDEDYKGWGDYWLGGVWAPTSYMVFKGLSAVGEHDLAKKLAGITYQNVAKVYKGTGTFWENYSPDLVSYGLPSRRDFCGWTALFPIAVYREYVGVEV